MGKNLNSFLFTSLIIWKILCCLMYFTILAPFLYFKEINRFMASCQSLPPFNNFLINRQMCLQLDMITPPPLIYPLISSNIR
jgi:hypothetical protein